MSFTRVTDFFKLQINFVTNDGRKVVDICVPITVNGGREYAQGVVIENHEPHIMNSAYAIGFWLGSSLVNIVCFMLEYI
jgi:hypothetical protein